MLAKLDRNVPEFARTSVVAAIGTALDDDSTADAGAERDQRERLIAEIPSRVFGVGCRVSIVDHSRRQASMSPTEFLAAVPRASRVS